jgi:hypothetical protein
MSDSPLPSRVDRAKSREENFLTPLNVVDEPLATLPESKVRPPDQQELKPLAHLCELLDKAAAEMF